MKEAKKEKRKREVYMYIVSCSGSGWLLDNTDDGVEKCGKRNDVMGGHN